MLFNVISNSSESFLASAQGCTLMLAICCVEEVFIIDIKPRFDAYCRPDSEISHATFF